MLINTTDEVRELLPVSTALEFSRLKPHLETTEQNFILPLLGTELFAVLDSFASGTTPAGPVSLPEILGTLLKQVRRAEIHLTYWMGYDILNAYISDGGFRRIETDKVKGLYKYQEDNLKDYFKVSGFNGLDTALEFIEANIESLPAFRSSQTWKNMKGSFIPDTRAFSSIYFIGNSRLVFLRLQPFFQVIEDLNIKIILGGENYSFIKAEMIKDEPDPKVVRILPFISKPMAFLSVAMLMEESGADLTDKGLFFEGRMQTMMSDTVKQPAELQRVASLIRRSRDLGESYLIRLKDYLRENAQEWNGIAPPKAGFHNRNNTGKRTFWA